MSQIGSQDDMNEQGVQQPFLLLALGAIFQDVLLSVPEFPAEDSKSRVASQIIRVGGNIPNTLAVLSQVVPVDARLLFVTAVGGDEHQWRPLIKHLTNMRATQVIYEVRKDQGMPTAYIIESQKKKSRTIVSYNDLKPLTTGEVRSLLWSHSLSLRDFSTQEHYDLLSQVYNAEGSYYPTWIHCESRNTETVIGVVSKFFQRREHKQNPFRLSIEFEKWGRERAGLAELLAWSDVAFFSETWAIGAVKEVNNLNNGRTQDVPIRVEEQGNLDLDAFIKLVTPAMKSSAVGYLTVGASGVYIIIKSPPSNTEKSWGWGVTGCSVTIINEWSVVHVPATRLESGSIQETTGAGDTFIAAVIYGIGIKRRNVVQAAITAVRVAGRKCQQYGFDGLGDVTNGFGYDEMVVDERSEITRDKSLGPQSKRLENLL